MNDEKLNEMADAGLDARIDVAGWGLLFLAIGAVSLVPGLPDGSWLIAAGSVMLGSGVVRAGLHLPVHGMTILVGVVALTAGIGSAAGWTTAIWPAVLVAFGLVLIARAAVETRRRVNGTSLTLG